MVLYSNFEVLELLIFYINFEPKLKSLRILLVYTPLSFMLKENRKRKVYLNFENTIALRISILQNTLIESLKETLLKEYPTRLQLCLYCLLK